MLELLTHLPILLATKACVELFEEHDAACSERVLPDDTVSIQRLGASAPGPASMEKFGLTVGNVVAKAKALG